MGTFEGSKVFESYEGGSNDDGLRTKAKKGRRAKRVRRKNMGYLGG